MLFLLNPQICFGMYGPGDSLIRFARIVTDYAVFAYIIDLFVLEEFRKQGLGKKLMAHIMNYPELQSVNRFMLANKDAHGLYEKFGFKLTKHADKIMDFERNKNLENKPYVQIPLKNS